MKCAKIKHWASSSDITDFKANKNDPLNSIEAQIYALLNAVAGKSVEVKRRIQPQIGPFQHMNINENTSTVCGTEQLM